MAARCNGITLSLILTIVFLLSGATAAQASDCMNDRPRLITPADEATALSSPVNFEWSPVAAAKGYRVSVVEENFDIDVIAETSQTSVSSRVAPGTYAWFVEAFFDDCESTVSDVHIFQIARAENCSRSAATLLVPVQGARVTSPVTFSWTPVPGALGYDVNASLDDGELSFVGETTATSLTAYLGEGHVTWEVEAEFNGCDDTTSRPSSFDIVADPACGNKPPLLIAPAFRSTNVPTTVDFIWTAVEGAKRYSVLVTTGDSDDVRTIGGTTTTRLRASVPAGSVSWAVAAEFDGCSPAVSPLSVFEAGSSTGCGTPKAPEVFLDPHALSGDAYLLTWSAAPSTALYEVQESAREDFAGAITRPVNDVALTLTHRVSETTRYYYRVHTLSSCGGGVGPYSRTASIIVSSPSVLPSADPTLALAYGRPGVVVQSVHVSGSTLPRGFTARADESWLTVTPASGTIPPEGIDLTVTARPRDLEIGTHTATIRLAYTSSAKLTVQGQPNPPASISLSLSLAAPVSPDPGNSPLPTSLIIPAVAHLQGAMARFQSDVRIVNTSAQTLKYLLNFTPSHTDGTRSGRQTTIQIGAGLTSALNDILQNFFGFGRDENVSGALEIRPLPAGGSGATSAGISLASSSTYSVTAGGSTGQFIPAILFSQFIGKNKDPNKPSPVLSLQQIVQTSAYRTNVGLVEGAGEPATVQLTMFGDQGQRLGVVPVSLLPGEQTQLNSFFQSQGFAVENGRIEVSVTSSTGRVTAYASVIDNRSNDATLILPVNLSRPTTNRVILPGMADLNNELARWRSDIRLFNPGAVDTNVTLTFTPQGSSTSTTRTAPVKAGQVLLIDNALQSFFGITNQGGVVMATVPDGENVVATARTFNQTESGSYGQFIPGIYANEGVGRESRALQLLQAEESDRFRTNLGLVELTGLPAVVEITAFTTELSLVARQMHVALRPNEFRQINSVLGQLGIPTTYNARITVKVVSGNGRVSAYASVIDNRTNDPTYVPAQ
ncbi:MAG TPA: hypothetical protein VHL58_11655 [Thermoanaerobaculia bacterium]|nr:hypothetical protein [Thermoanaerobaculia bacterium]